MVNSPSFLQMRVRNSDAVINLVRSNPGISRAELAEQADLAKSTVSVIVDDLLATQVLQEVGSRASSGGRPALGLRFNSMFGAVLGVCLDEQHVSLCVMDLDGNLIGDDRISVPLNWEAAQVSHLLTEFVDDLLGRLGISRSKVVALGAAIPGPFLPGVPSVAQYSHVIETVKTHLGCSTVVIDSNTNMAAIAEINQKSACPDENDLMLVVRLGHKVRSSLVVANKILSGSSRLAGEFGHIRFPSSRSLCSCGAVGCINTVAGVAAMIERCRQYDDCVETFDDLIDSCRNGSKSARNILLEAGEALGYGVAAAINLIAPQAVILSGPAVAAEEFILEPLRNAVSKYCLSDNLSACQIVVGQDAKNAECHGAGLQAYRIFSERLGYVVATGK